MILSVIPTQLKSRRLPGKNMKLMLGKPLIDYTIEYAKDCPLIDEIYVSTDSKKIAAHAIKKGVKVIIRPPNLCGNVAIVDVLRHIIRNIPNKKNFSHVVALQVDHPDRTVDLTGLLKRAIEQDIADTITIEKDGVRNGSIRILKIKDLMAGAISYSIMAVNDKCTNIHYQKEFEEAKKHLKQMMTKKKKRNAKKI